MQKPRVKTTNYLYENRVFTTSNTFIDKQARLYFNYSHQKKEAIVKFNVAS